MERQTTKLNLARLRAELILLGMLLARPGDRTQILGRINDYDIQNESVLTCVRAIRDGNPEPIRDVFRSWGFSLGSCAWRGVLGKIEEYAHRERSEEVISELATKLATDRNIEQVKESLRWALDEFESFKQETKGGEQERQ